MTAEEQLRSACAFARLASLFTERRKTSSGSKRNWVVALLFIIEVCILSMDVFMCTLGMQESTEAKRMCESF